MAGNPNRSLREGTQRLKGQTFTAIVVDNKDETMNQRVKVRVMNPTFIHEGVLDADLPWAVKKDQGTGAAAGVGSVNVPVIGSMVNIEFQDESPYYPRYFGAPTSDSTGVEKQLPGYPDTIGHIDPAGNMLYTNIKEGQVTVVFKHISGMTFKVENDGTTTVITKKVVVSSTGDMEFIAGGKLNLHGKGGVSIQGARVNIRDSGAKTPTALEPGQRPQVNPPPKDGGSAGQG